MKKLIALLLALALLAGVLPAAFAAEAAALPMELADAVDGVSAYLDASRTEGVYSDWTIFQLARSGNLSDELRAAYLAYMNEKIKTAEGVMDANNNTTYSRITLALTACGVDAANFAGYSMIAPLGDFDKTTRQGINGTLYALLALDCGNYTLPEGATATRERYVQELLDKELEGGGWAFFGSVADVDMTAMVIQALAPYYAQAEVKAAVDRGLAVLSALQQDDGGYVSWGTACSESPAQVLLALCCLGIDPAKDSRFVKEDGAWLGSAIFSFLADGEGVAFGHADRKANLLATQQVGYALAAYERLLDGKTTLYDMTDALSYAYVGVYDYTAVAAGAENASETGVVLANVPVTLHEGMTAAEVLQAAFDANGIDAKGVAEGYISEINGLGSLGGYSGWMLSYNNDDFSNWGLSSITPKAGDVLQLHYSMNLDTTTDDIGTGFYGLPVFTDITLGGVTKHMTRTVEFDESYNMTASYFVDGEPAEGKGTQDDPFVLTFDLGYDGKADGLTYTTSLDPHYAIVSGLKDADFAQEVDCSVSSLGGKYVAYFRIRVKAHDCLRYTDVDGHWARQEICTATELGLMNGTSLTEFAPEGEITRAMLVAILYRAAGATAQEKSTFADVAADAWYTEEVAWAQKEGIVGGVGGNCFAPERPVTREEFATILWRYAGKPEAETSTASFADAASVSDWALDAMNWAVSAGIINGTDGNRLDPQGTATRAQAAAMLCRFLAK